MYEELIKNLRSVKDTWQTQEEEWMLQAADAIEKLMALPAADVKPVVRGEWINRDAAFMECSACQALYLKQIDTRLGKAYWANPNFCPNCGADMRKERRE